MGFLRRRFGEQSTALGLGILVSALQAYLLGGTHAAIVQAVTGVAAVLMPENGAVPSVPSVMRKSVPVEHGYVPAPRGFVAQQSQGEA